MSATIRPLVRGYDELRLRIDQRAAGSYHVFASTRAAEASTTFELPFGALEIENFILRVSRARGRRRIETSAIGDARRFGGALFKALFSGEIYSLYREAIREARGQDRGVRITLCLTGAPELIDVPWEYLFDEPDFLAVSAFTPVVRYLDLPRAHRPLMVEPPLRLLGIISSPADYEQLDVDRERGNLERALSSLSDTGAVELQWLERPTLGELLKALQRQTFHAVHYIGHGIYDRDANRGALLFEDDTGWARPVSGEKLGIILHDFSSLRLAILNACEGARSARSDPFAGVAGALVQRNIPAVVAMQFEISDEAAIVFAGGFYQPLASGVPVDASLAAARLAMLAERSDDIEWGTPVLFMRVPDGRIFDLGDEYGPDTATPGAGSRQGGRRSSLAGRAGRTPRILINYRPEDTGGHALLLAERLGQHFGQENVHLNGIGTPNDRLARGGAPSVLLVLIGPSWLASFQAATAPARGEDFGRREIELALRDFPESLMPILIDASMPDPGSLPRSLRGLCRRTIAEVRHATFDRDLDSLIARLEEAAEAAGRHPQPTDSRIPLPAEQARAAVPATHARAAAGIPEPYHEHYVEVINGMLEGTVVPVLGPGIRASQSNLDHLAGPLAEQFEMHASGLAEVAQHVAVSLGERRLYTALKELVSSESAPTDVERFLAEFPGLLRRSGMPPRYQLIISANYDSGLERAFEDANEPFDYMVYVESSGWFVHVPWGERAAAPVAKTIVEPRRYVEFPITDDGQLERSIIVKIHGGPDGHEGGIAWRNNYVVTEDQYIDYLPTHNIQDHLPIQILDKLTGSRCLFLGYGLRNWNARVFLRRIWKGRPISESSWAIEQAPDALEKASWSVVGHVELLAASLPAYVTTLRSMLRQSREAQ